MDRRRLLLVAAAVVAALGAVLVFFYVRGADTRAEEQFDTVEVLVVTQTIEAGEPATDAYASGKIAIQPVPQKQVLPGAGSSGDVYGDMIALTTHLPGRAADPGEVRRSHRGGRGQQPLHPRGQARRSRSTSPTPRGSRASSTPARRCRSSSPARSTTWPPRAPRTSTSPGSCSPASRCSASARPRRSPRPPPTPTGSRRPSSCLAPSSPWPSTRKRRSGCSSPTSTPSSRSVCSPPPATSAPDPV